MKTCSILGLEGIYYIFLLRGKKVRVFRDLPIGKVTDFRKDKTNSFVVDASKIFDVKDDDSSKELRIRDYKNLHKEEIKNYNIEYRKKNREILRSKYKESKKRGNLELKLKVYRAYSGDGEIKCQICGKEDIRCLVLDHIDGGGIVHIKQMGGVHNVWRDLIKKNFPEGFQVLCVNCNWIKRKPQSLRKERVLTETEKSQSLKVKEIYRVLRYDVLKAYSGEEIKCKVCGDTRLEVLCLDHINGGGTADRRKRSLTTLMYDLRDQGYPGGFQVLCQNCNRIKMHENKEWFKVEGMNVEKVKRIYRNNKSGYEGLHYDKTRNRWTIQITRKKKKMLKYFPYTDEGKLQAIKWREDIIESLKDD